MLCDTPLERERSWWFRERYNALMILSGDCLKVVDFLH